MVDVGGDDEIILSVDQLEQVTVDRVRRVDVAVVVDVARPPCPEGFFVGEWIEAAGIHIADAVARGEIGKVFLEARAAVGQSRRGGKSRACADDDRVGMGDRFAELSKIFVIGSLRQMGIKGEYSCRGDAFFDRLAIAVRH